MKKIPMAMCMSIILFSPLLAHSGMALLEHGYNRPGGTYLGHYDNLRNPSDCMNICKGHTSCVAFTWVKPGIQGPGGFCWLKGTVPNKAANQCCVSASLAKRDRASEGSLHR